MFAKDMMTNDIVPLKTSDTGQEALSWMDEYRLSHLPIVNNTEFLGLISDLDIYNMNMPEESLGNHTLSLNMPSVLDDKHMFDVLKIFHENRLTLLPVVNQKNKYLGSITLRNLVKNFSEITSIQNPGGILVLEVNQNDYSLAEITRLVESNDIKVLSSYITTFPDSTKMEVTIKMNKIDITPIIQTFLRFNYIIKASFNDTEPNNDLQENYDSFMNYLNI